MRGSIVRSLLALPAALATAAVCAQTPQPQREPRPADDSVEFHLAHGDWIALLARNGFTVTALHELYAPKGAPPSRFDWMTNEWAARWPVEELWTARLMAPA